MKRLVNSCNLFRTSNIVKFRTRRTLSFTHRLMYDDDDRRNKGSGFIVPRWPDNELIPGYDYDPRDNFDSYHLDNRDYEDQDDNYIKFDEFGLDEEGTDSYFDDSGFDSEHVMSPFWKRLEKQV